ncbi:M50 family metallopeptidase [Neolewinella antarctica]|uniref:Zn-dependent protease n=1 Tax=Neolewinella antarctica TaxID=442734 RepID=A0ABX0XD61_9BACT|nr:M50 family metallopeptidase [Neolewinella antarctica]NJC27196.1 Zn-dependent protease [Neolewinella antarctica]
MDVHWTFLLVPPAILYFSYRPGQGLVTEAMTWYAAIAILLFLFVLVHELGHALMARTRHVLAERIIIFPLGGGAYLPDRPQRRLDEVLIYSAGPLANLLLAAVALPILLAQSNGELILRGFLNLAGNFVVEPSLFDQLLGVTVIVNVLLALGNLLPAYPLDGGRILRAVLRGPFGERPATVVVTVLGIVIGLALIYVSYLLGDPLLGLGAAFIVTMSVVTFRDGWQRRRLAAYPIEHVLRTNDGPVMEQRIYVGTPTREAVALFDKTGWPVLPVYSQWNQLSGFVAREVLEEEDPKAKGLIGEVTELEFISAHPGENLLEVTERIVDANVYGAAVYGERRRLVGFVFTEDVMRVLGK